MNTNYKTKLLSLRRFAATLITMIDCEWQRSLKPQSISAMLSKKYFVWVFIIWVIILIILILFNTEIMLVIIKILI